MTATDFLSKALDNEAAIDRLETHLEVFDLSDNIVHISEQVDNTTLIVSSTFDGVHMYLVEEVAVTEISAEVFLRRNQAKVNEVAADMAAWIMKEAEEEEEEDSEYL